MKVYVLHECIDSSDFYAEGNVIIVDVDRMKVLGKMIDSYNECKEANDPIDADETWCDNWEAHVVSNSDGSYYRHHWKINEFEV